MGIKKLLARSKILITQTNIQEGTMSISSVTRMAPVESPVQALLRVIDEETTCPISLAPAAEPVQLVPCGHPMDRINAVELIRRGAGRAQCSMCRTPFQSYLTNNQNIVEARRRVPPGVFVNPDAARQTQIERMPVGSPSRAAIASFEVGKLELAAENYERAVAAFLEALSFSPDFAKAQAFLDFALDKQSAPAEARLRTVTPPGPQASSSSSSGQPRVSGQNVPRRAAAAPVAPAPSLVDRVSVPAAPAALLVDRAAIARPASTGWSLDGLVSGALNAAGATPAIDYLHGWLVEGNR